MGLRPRIALTLLAILAALAGVALVLLEQGMARNLDRIDRLESRAALRRVLGAMEAQLSELNGVLASWGNWSALQQHVRAPDTRFRDEELTPPALAVARLDWLLLLDNQGQIVDLVEVPQHGGARPATEELRMRATTYRDFFARGAVRKGCGVTQAAGRLALICFSPVLDSEGVGPSHGVIVLGRWLNERIQGEVSERTGLAFEIHVMAQASTVASAGEIESPLGRGDPRVTVTAEQLDIRFPLVGVLNHPIGELRVRAPRPHAADARAAFGQVRWMVLALMLSSALVLVGLIDRVVVRPLARLRGEVATVMRQADWSGQITVSGRNEIAELAGYIDRMRSLMREHLLALRDLSRTDTLTGLPNRRALDEAAQRALANHQRLGTPVSLVLIDVDHFKRYNDHHGHPAGDKVLVALAGAMRAVLQRGTDLPARMGGEEFAVLLEGCGADQALALAKRLRAGIAALSLPHDNHPDGGQHKVTVSAGVASAMASDNWDSLYQRTDQALYQAKQQGRDQVRCAAG
ncbi:MAG: diguanylate cyclase [Hydrogenophaga sp.]|uniref:sensor domain-containing diguanylate cyclase n=1 Tax=Hydrogenophaga sp. TaxID=1904254 RepID=UPI0027377416|nr:diguanylate cyclase [Hydrogenophaga sp.]MDP3626299.1 diguanylate cyclase [Hydrogenophaga sp.]